MVRALGRSCLLLLLVACGSDKRPAVDGGDSGVDSGVDRPDGAAEIADGPPDTSTGDGSAQEVSDAPVAPDGPLDAPGDTPIDAPPDAPPDASADGPQEMPADGHATSCDEATHDPVLGTARLGAGFRVVDFAPLPVTSWLPAALVTESLPGGTNGLVAYGYAGNGRVHRLGAWNTLAAPEDGNLAFDAVSAEDRALQVLVTPLVVTTHGQLLVGYRTIRSLGFVSGGVAVFDTAQPAAGPRLLPAPGMESALGIGSFFLVGGDGLGEAAAGRGVYAINADNPKEAPHLVATYPTVPGENVRPGLMALTANGIVVIGHYLDGTSRHSLRLPEPSLFGVALTGGPPVDLSKAPEMELPPGATDDVASLTSLGAGVAVLHTRTVRGILPALGRLDFYAFTRVGGDAGTVVAAPTTILSAQDDGCTAVSQLVPITGGQSFIVGLWDRNGQRLVRIAPN